jgi:transposase
MPRTSRHPCPSDLTDREWALLEPLLASPERRGRPPKWPARRGADAVFYLLGSCCAWRMLPREHPTRVRRYTTAPGSGAGTGDCAELTTGSGRRFEGRRGASATRARP